MKEQLVLGNVSNEDELRGRCSAIQNLIELTYEELVDGVSND